MHGHCWPCAGGACLLLSLGMAGAWYVWDARAVGNDTVLNWVLLALLVLVPCALVTVLAGSLLRAEPALLARLAELRRSGVRVAIDDFGTGYSSLGYLHELPFDTIKIDRSFVRNLESDARAQAIIGTIVELSKRLGREIVAEGVETEEQFAILNSLDCQRVQGWLLGKPMPAEEIEKRFLGGGEPKFGDSPWTEAAGA